MSQGGVLPRNIVALSGCANAGFQGWKVTLCASECRECRACLDPNEDQTDEPRSGELPSRYPYHALAGRGACSALTLIRQCYSAGKTETLQVHALQDAEMISLAAAC